MTLDLVDLLKLTEYNWLTGARAEFYKPTDDDLAMIKRRVHRGPGPGHSWEDIASCKKSP